MAKTESIWRANASSSVAGAAAFLPAIFAFGSDFQGVAREGEKEKKKNERNMRKGEHFDFENRLATSLVPLVKCRFETNH